MHDGQDLYRIDPDLAIHQGEGEASQEYLADGCVVY